MGNEMTLYLRRLTKTMIVGEGPDEPEERKMPGN